MPVIAITGSNGKSTVTTGGEMIAEAGLGSGSVAISAPWPLELLGQPMVWRAGALSSFQLGDHPQPASRPRGIEPPPKITWDRLQGMADHRAAKMEIHQYS